MGRHTKQTVEYFPHYVNHGKTLHILQHLYGNDGYAFFYKLLEVLGDSEGHFYDCRDEISKEYLASKTHLSWISGAEILNKLNLMGIIDAELWDLGIIWMDSFVESVKDAYRKRSVSVPEKPQASSFLPPEMQHDDISTAGSTQSKVKESIVNNKPSPAPETAPVIDQTETVITTTMAEAIPLAQLMYDSILIIDPKFKTPKLSKWADEIEKLIRIDCRSPGEIKSVIEWVYQDSFWRGNILSGGKLREKYTQLLAKMQSKSGSAGRFTNGEDFRRKYEAGEI